MDKNFMLCTVEDAWEEFERVGEITNSADNLLSVVQELQMQNEKLLECAADLATFREGTSYHENAYQTLLDITHSQEG